MLCAIGVFLTQTIWSDQLLPYWVKPVLFAKELSWMTATLAFCAILGALLVMVIGARLRSVVGTIALVFGLLLTIASWQNYSLLGVFLDSHALEMIVNDGSQLLQHLIHAVPGRLVLSVCVSFVLTIIALLVIRFLSRVDRNRQFAFSYFTVLTAVVVSFVATVGGAFVSASDTQLVDSRKTSYSLAEYSALVSADNVGPFSRIKQDIVGSFKSSNLMISDSLVVNRNPRISMQDYLAQPAQDVKKYNVVLILVESLRSDQLPAFGGTLDVMPALQKLAAKGWVFQNAYSTASHSNYADLPPLSSHYPLRSWRTHFYPENPSYPRVLIYDVLKSIGYRTGIFSSQNENWGGMANYLDTGSLDAFIHAETFDGKLRQDENYVGEDLHDWMVKAKRSGKIDDSDTVSEALSWLQTDQDKPFFMYLNFQNSHFPYVVPDGFSRKYVSNEDPLLNKLKSIDLTDMPIEFLKRAYSDSLSYIDSQLSRLVEQLEKDGRADETIFIVSADTATRVNENFFGNGGKLYEEVVKVPLVITGPGIETQSDDRFVSHMDIPPTVLDALQLPAHPAFQGRSLLDGQGDSMIFLVAQTPIAQQYAIIDDGWKLLYDVKSEKNVLTRLDGSNTQPESPEAVQQLVDRLHTWIGLQIDYYQNLGKYSDTYPPVVAPPEQLLLNHAQIDD